MTIDESKTVLTTHREHWKRLLSEGICDAHEGKETISALTIAIASFEAWDKVKAETIAESDNKSNNMQFNLGLLAALAIINGHFKEVGNGQTE